jgi:MerR family copper efflux transcriptional regulator
MRIGALAAAAGTTAKTIRFYEQAGLLPAPPRTTAGYRDYPGHAPARLAFIRAAQSAGLTLAEIRGILAVRDHGRPPCTHVTALLGRHLAETERRLAELARTRAMLSDLLATAQATDPDACSGGICTILDPPGPETRAETGQPGCCPAAG